MIEPKPTSIESKRLSQAETAARSAQGRENALKLEQHQVKIDIYPGIVHTFTSNDNSHVIRVEYVKAEHDDQSELIVYLDTPIIDDQTGEITKDNYGNTVVEQQHLDMASDYLGELLEKEFGIVIHKFNIRYVAIYSTSTHNYSNQQKSN
jgi:hypothetical protein